MAPRSALLCRGGATWRPGRLSCDGLSAQTYNHYLKAAKSFCRWLVRDQRSPADPLAHVTRLNVRADRRHDRRALSEDEFKRLVAAATAGPVVQGITGPDRAMMYVLAAWTGFRKGEIGSLTPRSLRLDGEPAIGRLFGTASIRVFRPGRCRGHGGVGSAVSRIRESNRPARISNAPGTSSPE